MFKGSGCEINMTNDSLNYCVYCHINKINNKSYIGITCKDVNIRWRKDGSGYKGSPRFWNAIQKYGWDSFEHVVLFEKLTRDEACKIEVLLIATFNTQNDEFGYNISNGGDFSFTGLQLSDEHRRKISKAKKGKPGTKHTQETKLKMSKSKIGELNPMYGKNIVWSDSTKEKFRITKLGELNPLYGKFGAENHKSIPICQCDKYWNVINIFWGFHEAERVTGIKAGNISSVCNKTPTKNGYVRHTAGGYNWRHATEEDFKNAKSISV